VYECPLIMQFGICDEAYLALYPQSAENDSHSDTAY
jgi:hypothetical protein